MKDPEHLPPPPDWGKDELTGYLEGAQLHGRLVHFRNLGLAHLSEDELGNIRLSDLTTPRVTEFADTMLKTRS